MTPQKITKQLRIDRLDDHTVFISNKHFNFMFINADDVVKPQFVGMYEYLGGLQCNFENHSPEYIELEGILCELAKRVLNINNERTESTS